MRRPFLAVLLPLVLAAPEDPPGTSDLWRQYREARRTGDEPVLPDFSYAGYRHGQEPVPSTEWKVFDVTEHGALPDDEKSDKAAIVAAIAAAEKHGSGIVFFPKGRFLINEPSDAKNEKIRIRGSRIVLRGSGSGAGGTELFMNVHLDPRDPEKLYSSPYMVEFRGKGKTKVETEVTGNARRETHALEVEDASLFEPGDWVVLHVRDNSPESVAAAVAPYEPDPKWKQILETGVMVDEIHQIEAIEDSRITFKEPIHVDVQGSGGWKVIGYGALEEVGVESIAFVGNWQGKFRHHRSFLDDGGWSGLAMAASVNGWIKNCRFTDWNRPVSLKGAAAVTVSNVVLDGNKGHSAISLYASSHVLVRDALDSAGHHHASGVGGTCSGNVFLRCEYRPDTCFEAHASQPRCTLFDNVSGGWTYGRWGGSVSSQPNHLHGLVFWNYENTGRGRSGKYRFMRTDSTYGRILMPYVVGFHGNAQEFDESQVEVLESNGARVLPDSLYEAQFRLRMEPGDGR